MLHLGNTSAIFHTWELLSLMNSRLDKNKRKVERQILNLRCRKTASKKKPFYMRTEIPAKCPVISVL